MGNEMKRRELWIEPIEVGYSKVHWDKKSIAYKAPEQVIQFVELREGERVISEKDIWSAMDKASSEFVMGRDMYILAVIAELFPVEVGG